MLFTYPIEATAGNSLHDCLTEMMTAAFEAKAGGAALSAWPHCIPEAHRGDLEGRPKFQELYDAVVTAVNGLDDAGLAQSIEACAGQNNLPNIFDGQTPCRAMTGLPPALLEALDKFYRYCFGLLTPLGLRDAQFDIIYSTENGDICPFCGVEPFEAPKLSRPDLDHYLAISRYPFAGANLKNLVPMGDKCNRRHKRADDVLYCSQNIRREVLDPFGDVSCSVSLLNSNFYTEDLTLIDPQWDVDLGNQAHSLTWDDVWNIRDRYSEGVLKKSYKSWLSQFGNWCSKAKIPTQTAPQLIAALALKIDQFEYEGFADRAFLKKAFFELLMCLVQDPAFEERTVEFLNDLVS